MKRTLLTEAEEKKLIRFTVQRWHSNIYMGGSGKDHTDRVLRITAAGKRATGAQETPRLLVRTFQSTARH